MFGTRLLHQFVAVAEELHFNRSAQRLHMAQPSLGQAIRRLEFEVGAILFERTNRSLSLTSAGIAFLDSARKILHSLEESIAHVRCVTDGVEGLLRLTFINIVPYGGLLRALKTFRETFLRYPFSLREAITQEQVEALETGRADSGFMKLPGAGTPHLYYETLLCEPIKLPQPGSTVIRRMEGSVEIVAGEFRGTGLNR